MAVDLGDLIESLRREVSPPGRDLYPGATEEDWLGHLQDAFWEARLHGMLAGYIEADGTITPTNGSTDMPRDLQQLIVLYAGYRVVLTSLQNTRASFRAQAGPVAFETSVAATVLRDVLKALKEKINLVITRLSDLGYRTDAVVFDAVIERTASLADGTSTWVR